MNCKHVQELLPLYVGGDLEEKGAKLVTAHVQSCAECAGSAAEYRETLQLVQLFEPPAFGEATYSALRRSVQREIERQSNQPTLFDFITRPFQPRVLWAVSSVVLLAFCLSVYHFVANRNDGQSNGSQIAGDHGGGQNPSGRTAPGLKSEPVGGAGAAPVSRRTLPGSRLNLPAQKIWHPTRSGGAPPPSLHAKSAPYSPPVEPHRAFFNTAADSEKALRMEIQTKDPNVRIIWFSHQRTKQDLPGESSKGI